MLTARDAASQNANAFPAARPQFFDAAGNPLAGGFVYTFQAGGSVQQATYTDSTASVVNSDPISLDSAGRSTCPTPGTSSSCGIWLTPATLYRIAVYDKNMVLQYTADNVWTPAGTTLLAGNDKQVLYNCLGLVCGKPTFQFNYNTDTLSVPSLAFTVSGAFAGAISGAPTASGTWTWTAGLAGAHGGCSPTGSTGDLRLCKDGSVCWRNNAGTADNCLSQDALDSLVSAMASLKLGPGTDGQNIKILPAGGKWGHMNLQSSADTAGSGNVNVAAADSATGSSVRGGDVNVTAGAGSPTDFSARGGDVNMAAGSGSLGSEQGGGVTISSGNAGAAAIAGSVNINGGTSSAGTSGSINLTPGAKVGGGNAGAVNAIGLLRWKRPSGARGTPLAAGNVGFAGWGAGAVLTTVTGFDSGFFLQLQSGAGPGAFPTVTVTFADGAWAAPPICVATRGTTGGGVLGEEFNVATTATTAVLTLNSNAPAGANAFPVYVVCQGVD